MVEQRHPVYDFIDFTNRPDANAELVEQIKNIHKLNPLQGESLGRNVAFALIVEYHMFALPLMKIGQIIPHPQDDILLTTRSLGIAAAYVNPALVFFNAEHQYRTGKPLDISEEEKSDDEYLVSGTSDISKLTQEVHEAEMLVHEVEVKILDQVLVQMIPKMTTLEFIDNYIAMRLNRLSDDEFDAPIRAGLILGGARFHALYIATELALGLQSPLSDPDI